jgi:cold shock CspA family protein
MLESNVQYTGKIVTIQLAKGYGFISLKDSKNNIFFHAKSLETGYSINDMKIGDDVRDFP